MRKRSALPEGGHAARVTAVGRIFGDNLFAG